jgi:uncharacterized short protein YbdD (DUF466 family)
MRPEGEGLTARCLSALRRMAGMPDYAAFVAQHRLQHPDLPVPSEREYYAQYVAARYGDGNGPTRCC